MKLFITATLLALSASAWAETAPHWSYEGQAGPANWGNLSEKFATCKIGNATNLLI